MQNLKVNCILIATIFFWASAFVGIKIGLAGYSPGHLALLRFIVASVCMAIMYRFQELEKKMSWQDCIILLLTGVAGIGIYNVCLNYGELAVSAGIASFIIGLMPVFTVLLCLIFLKEKLSKIAWIGIFISLIGLALLTLGEGNQPGIVPGILLILVSAFVGAFLTMMQKHMLQKHTPITILSWVIWGGTLSMFIFLPSLWSEMKNADVHITAAVIYLGIFPGALAYLGWGYVLKKLSASGASVTLYALPIVSTLLGFICLGEKPGFLSLLGGGISLIGAFISHRFQDPDYIEPL